MAKKYLAGLLAVMLLVSLMGCSAQLGNLTENSSDMEAPEYFYRGDSIADSSAQASGQTVQSNQKLIKTVRIRAETEDLDGLLSGLNQRIDQLGGYVENRDLYNGNSYSGYRTRRVTMTVRIPAERLHEFVDHVDGASNILSSTENQENVTLTYVDMESRVLALQTEQTRLLELLAKAGSMSDLLEIEKRLTEVRYELESITSKLRALDNQVEYATVELELEQVEILTQTQKQTVWQRIGSGFLENVDGLWKGLQDFFVWVVTFSPQLLILAGITVVIVVLCKRSAKKRKAKSQPPVPPYYQPPQQPDSNQT